MKHLAWVFGLFVITSVCKAQTFEDQGQALRDALVKKTLYLRGFGADDQLNYVWTGKSLETVDPAVHTFAALKINEVKITQTQIEIDATRKTMLIKKDKSLVAEGMDSPVKLLVTLRGAEPATLSRLPDLLFYPSPERALADVPEEFHLFIPAPFETIHMPEKVDVISGTPPCDCAENDPQQCGREEKSPGWVPAKAQANFNRPPIPEEARISKKQDITGSYVYSVDEHGHSENFWIALPAGFGMDEETLRMLLHIPYRPATCHDKPTEQTRTFRFDLHMHYSSPH